jgi:hypothetical protein
MNDMFNYLADGGAFFGVVLFATALVILAFL